jgi:hypothetical protein
MSNEKVMMGVDFANGADLTVSYWDIKEQAIVKQDYNVKNTGSSIPFNTLIPEDLNLDKYLAIDNNNLIRWLTGQRSLFYVFRKKVGDKYVCYYSKCKLLYELLEIYKTLSPDERNTFVHKNATKAE